MKRFTVCCLTIMMTIGHWSCTKTRVELPYERKDFFKSSDDAFQQVKKALQQLHPGDSLLSIGNISYLDTKQQTCAFVYYTSLLQQGESNLVFQHLYYDDMAVGSYITCSGPNCDCKVRAIIKSNGEVNLDCTCSTCTMQSTPTKLDDVEQ